MSTFLEKSADFDLTKGDSVWQHDWQVSSESRKKVEDGKRKKRRKELDYRP